MIQNKIKEALNRFAPETILFWIICCLIVKAGVFYMAYTEVQSQGRVPVICSWDCPYYEEIATKGYSYSPVHGPMAFFPLFPLAVKAVRQFIPGDFGWVGAGLNFSLYSLVILMFLIFSKKVGIKHWWLPSLIWSLDRFSFWSVIPYTEVLFLIWMFSYLLILRFYEGPWAKVLGAFLGGLSTANRLVGVAIVGSLGLGNFKYFLKRPLFGALCLLLGVWGVAAFWGYLQVAFGDWKLSLITTSHWGRYFDAMGLFKSSFFLIKSFYFPTLMTTVFTLLWIFKSPLKLLSHEKWLMGILFLIPIMNSIPISLTRYFSILIFGHMAWAYYIEKGFESSKVWHKVLSWLLILALLPEPFWQIKLLAKFLRVEVFNWAG